MPIARLNRFKRPPIDAWPFQDKLHFSQGLFGFERLTCFSLIGHRDEAPYLRLVADQNSAISFFVTDPFPFHPDYEPVIRRSDLDDLGVVDEAKLILFAIANPHDRPSTLNLEAPLLIHWHKRHGKQLLFKRPSQNHIGI